MPLAIPVLLDLGKQENRQWAEKLGFVTLIHQDWETLVALETAEEMVRNFVDTNTLVAPRKLPVEVTTKLVQQVLGLHDEGLTESPQNFHIEAEIRQRGKSEDMSAKNYNKLKAAEEGEEKNWVAICLENL